MNYRNRILYGVVKATKYYFTPLKSYDDFLESKNYMRTPRKFKKNYKKLQKKYGDEIVRRRLARWPKVHEYEYEKDRGFNP